MDDQFLHIDEFYKDLIVNVLSGRALPEEKEMLTQWMAQSDENKVYFSRMKHAWQLSSVLQKSKRFDAEYAWQQAIYKIETGKKKKREYHFNVGIIIRMAAFWVLTFVLGGLVTYFGFIKTLSVGNMVQKSVNEIIAPLGSKSQIYLPDGTMVWLNAGSKLRYAQTYNTQKRDVYLEGEAYFKVKTNPEKPFVVKTSEVSVTAYGTAFNVKAYPNEGTITTTLVEGIVKVEGTDETSGKFEVSLKPNQSLTYTRKMPAVGTTSLGKNVSASGQDTKNTEPVVLYDGIKTNLYTSWKDDKWIVEREKLDDLVVKLERRYDVTFVYKSEALKKYKISGIIRKETLEQVLDILKLAAPIKYTIKDGVVTLDIEPSRMENYFKIMK